MARSERRMAVNKSQGTKRHAIIWYSVNPFGQVDLAHEPLYMFFHFQPGCQGRCVCLFIAQFNVWNYDAPGFHSLAGVSTMMYARFTSQFFHAQILQQGNTSSNIGTLRAHWDHVVGDVLRVFSDSTLMLSAPQNSIYQYIMCTKYLLILAYLDVLSCTMPPTVTRNDQARDGWSIKLA